MSASRPAELEKSAWTLKSPFALKCPLDDSMSFRKLENEAEAVSGWFRMDVDAGKKQRSFVTIDLDWFDAGDAGE